MVDADAGGSGHAHGGDPGETGGHEPCKGLLGYRAGVGEVAARHGEQPVFDVQRIERTNMLIGLRRPTLISGNDEQNRRDRADPREHVGREALVTGHVDEGHLLP